MTYFCIRQLNTSISIYKIVFKSSFDHLELFLIHFNCLKYILSESHLLDSKYIQQPGYLKIFHCLGLENKRQHSDVKMANKFCGSKNFLELNYLLVYFVYIVNGISQWLQGKTGIVLQTSFELKQIYVDKWKVWPKNCISQVNAAISEMCFLRHTRLTHRYHSL